MEEKRAHKRRLMHEHAFVSEADPMHWYPVVLMDISAQGVKFASATALKQGENYILRFFLPSGQVRHHVAIKAVHSSSDGVPAGFGIGARFLDVEPRTAQAIAYFLAHPALT